MNIFTVHVFSGLVSQSLAFSVWAYDSLKASMLCTPISFNLPCKRVTLPLGTVTTVTPTWMVPLGAATTVTRGLYHWARLRPSPQRGLNLWARLRPLPQSRLDLGWDWILPKPAVFTELQRRCQPYHVWHQLFLMYATPATMVSAKIAPVREYFAPAPVTTGKSLPTCHAELFSH